MRFILVHNEHGKILRINVEAIDYYKEARLLKENKDIIGTHMGLRNTTVFLQETPDEIDQYFNLMWR